MRDFLAMSAAFYPSHGDVVKQNRRIEGLTPFFPLSFLSFFRRNHCAQEREVGMAFVKVVLDRWQYPDLVSRQLWRRLDISLKVESQRPGRNIAQLSRSQTLLFAL